MRIIRAHLFLTVLPLLVAVLIYVLFRTSPPEPLNQISALFLSLPISYPKSLSWFVFCTPDGLWAFGFTSFLLLSSRNDTRLTRAIYIVLGFACMLVLEIYQGRWFPGTFDPLDLVAILIGFILSILIFQLKIKTHEK